MKSLEKEIVKHAFLSYLSRKVRWDIGPFPVSISKIW